MLQIDKKIWMMVSIAVIVSLSVGILSLTGCKKEPEVYKIGAIAPLTGEGATYGEAMKKGIDLAVEEINKRGGINGVKLVVIYRDSKLVPKEAISAFRYLVTAEKIPVILGAAASSVSLTLAPLANESRVVLLSSISTADALREAGDYFFRNIPPNRNQAKTAVYFIKNYLGRRKVLILYENNDYGINMDKVFSEFFNNIGGVVVDHESYESGQKDFRSILSKVKRHNPDVIYIPGTYRENALILRQARAMGIKSIFIGGDGAYSPELIKIAGDAAEGFYCTLMALPKSTTSPKIVKFFKAYHKKYKEDVNVYSAYSYDALNMVALAIERGGYTGEGIKNALYKIAYDGVTGKTQFDEYGEVDKPYFIYVVKEKKFELLPWTPKF